MRNYRTLIAIHGLRRADLTRRREPIAHDEVIALPEGYARNLLAAGAVEKSDAEVTVELAWDAPVELIKANDRDKLLAAVQAQIEDGHIAQSDIAALLTTDMVLNDVAYRINNGALAPAALAALIPPPEKPTGDDTPPSPRAKGKADAKTAS